MRTRPFGPRGGLLAALVLTLQVAPLAGQAQSELPPEGDGPYARHPEATEAIARLKSPYCPGLMLEVCPSGGGAALRDSIETLADEGWDADQIVEWVVANHGEKYRAMPKRQGAGWLAWLMPPFAVLAGVGLVVYALLRMRRRKEERPDTPVAEPTPDEEARLREALAELEAEEEVPFL